MTCKKIHETVMWWNNNYNRLSDNECWCIVSRQKDIVFKDYSLYSKDLTNEYNNKRRYFIVPINMIVYEEQYNEKCEQAKRWGWMLEKNKIVGFNKRTFSKVKHLIPAIELGLL